MTGERPRPGQLFTGVLLGVLVLGLTAQCAARSLEPEDALPSGEGWSVGDMLRKVLGRKEGPPEKQPRSEEVTAVVRDENVLQAFGKSFVMIMVTELGDETFIIAAIMAMRHPRLVVYLGAMSALAFMTIISTALGYVLPNLISKQATHHAASILYTFFGVRLLWIAWRSGPHESNQEEVEEVQQKVIAAESSHNQVGRLHRTLNKILTPVFLEALVLTFIAEWGDRSQIATITLATQYNPYGVTVGAIIGHCLCTGTAVLGGQLLAMRISQRTVAICGGVMFLLFAVHSIFTSAT
ncbi:hypothetical protein WJX72_008556 [[Myrmecia] bisecta]|uniref:GDT1 family protein n=1 Tax=[Myrmecia] bisecta TaxID=41462 RepID=A0AAW1Q4H5_9CHLO